MEQMLIGGYTLDQLKKIQTAVKKDASKIISEAIQAATDAMDEMLQMGGDEDDDEEISPETLAAVNVLAAKAAENLELASTVSSISDVEYYLPYSSEYDSDGYYYKFECSALDTYSNKDSIYELMGKLEDMEYTSKQWHQSTC